MSTRDQPRKLYLRTQFSFTLAGARYTRTKTRTMTNAQKTPLSMVDTFPDIHLKYVIPRWTKDQHQNTTSIRFLDYQQSSQELEELLGRKTIFAPMYSRHNKSQTKKHLRCFPHCRVASANLSIMDGTPQHHHIGMCGSSVFVSVERNQTKTDGKHEDTEFIIRSRFEVVNTNQSTLEVCLEDTIPTKGTFIPMDQVLNTDNNESKKLRVRVQFGTRLSFGLNVWPRRLHR